MIITLHFAVYKKIFQVIKTDCFHLLVVDRALTTRFNYFSANTSAKDTGLKTG